MMFKTLIAKCSSLNVKLFLCFWLIIALTVLTTRLITLPFAEDLKHLPAHKGDMRKLDKIINQRGLSRVKQLTKLTTRDIKRTKKNNHWAVIAKNFSTKELLAPKAKNLFRVKKYLEANEITKAGSVQFNFLRLTGPKQISIEGQTYQLFYLNFNRRGHWSTYLRELPPWAHISIAMSISLIICWLLARSFSKPIKTMQQASHRFGNGQLDSRVEGATDRNDELGELARSFNQMADNLAISINAQQRLLADVSHELRTPLTRLQIAVGLARQADISPEKLEQYLSRCEQEVMQLDQMIADVLTLSRMENSVKKATLVKTELCEFVQSIINDCQFLANDKNIKIHFECTQQLYLNLDHQLFNSALSNIINNAIKYSPSASNINVQVNQENNHVAIKISDQGPGIATTEINNIFTPFYRVNQIRDKNDNGTGLGLAITKQAIDLHQGEIIAKNNLDTGLTIEIKLPIIND